MEVQAVLFNKDKWTSTKARTWLKKHDYKPIKRAHITKNEIRFRITEPKYDDYRTIKLNNSGIELVLGKNKKKK